MTAKELIDALGIDKKALAKWIDRGLPFTRGPGTRRNFDPAKVRQWLIAQGLADASVELSTRDEVARHFGVSLRTVASWLAAGCPGRSGHYDTQAIVAWRDAQRAVTDERDPLLDGVASPALERYRDERAKLARLDRLARERSLLPRDEVHTLLTQIAALLRGAGELLQRQYGQAAQDVLDAALDEAQALIDSLDHAPDPHA